MLDWEPDSRGEQEFDPPRADPCSLARLGKARYKPGHRHTLVGLTRLTSRTSVLLEADAFEANEASRASRASGIHADPVK